MTEKNLETICPNCDEEVMFMYLGEQERVNKEPFQLYNCSNCKSTRSSLDIEEYNSEK